MPDTDDEEDKCPICLSEIVNPSQPENCKHIFCLEHLRKWAMEKTTCPLCNAEFKKIRYSLNKKTGKFRKTEELQAPRPPENIVALGLENSWPRLWAARRDEDMIDTVLEELNAQRERRQRLWEARFARSTPSCIRARRTVYRTGRRVEIQFKREFSAEFYQANEAQTHRLTPWIRREIVALYGSTDRRYLNDLIIDIQHHAIELGIESRQFREFLTHHMHNYATHFIHELKGFASAKEYDIRSYDRNARYAPAKRMGTRRNPQTETPGAPERIMPIDDPDDPTPILIEDDDEEAPGPSGIGRRNTNRQPRRRTTTNDFETLVLDQEDLPPFAPDFPVVDWDDPALDGHSTDSSNADGDAETPPRLEPEFPNRPGTSSLNRQPPQRRQGIQMARVSNIPIGDSNPLLNPVNIPIHPREGRGHAFLPHRRQRPMNTIASRIYNEMQNRREVVDTIVIDDDSPAPRRPVVHRSRLELEIESRQQVIDLVNSSDDEEAVNSTKPNRSSDAFNPARSNSPPRIPKRQNTTEENREAIVILSESDNESDIECVTPQQKRPRYSFHDCSYDPEDIDQPGPSSLNYL